MSEDMDPERQIEESAEATRQAWLRALGMDGSETEKERRYVDDPSEAPEDVQVQEGPQGGLWYETDDTASSGAESDATSDTDVDSMVDDMPIRDWPDEHTQWSTEQLREETRSIFDRTDPDVAETLLSNFGGLRNKEKQSSYRFMERDIVLRPDVETEALAHEFGHATLGAYGYTINDIGNMLAHFYANEVPEVAFGEDVVEVAERLVEERLNHPDFPEEHRQDTLDALEDVRERYAGMTFEREDMHLFIPDGWDGPGTTEDVQRLADAVNTAWDKQIDAAQADDADPQDYIIGKPYSATNAHETMAMTHESLQGDVADPHAMENLYRNQQELLAAYTNLFEPATIQKDMLNQLFKEFGPNDVWNDVPYPDAEGVLEE